MEVHEEVVRQKMEWRIIGLLADEYQLTLDKASDCLIQWKNHEGGEPAIRRLLALAEFEAEWKRSITL